MTTTAQHIDQALKGIEGLHGRHTMTVENGTVMATAHGLLALVAEQQATNGQLASIATSLERIATALENKPPTPAPEPEPKRRFWLPGQRTN